MGKLEDWKNEELDHLDTLPVVDGSFESIEDTPAWSMGFDAGEASAKIDMEQRIDDAYDAGYAEGVKSMMHMQRQIQSLDDSMVSLQSEIDALHETVSRHNDEITDLGLDLSKVENELIELHPDLN